MRKQNCSINLSTKNKPISPKNTVTSIPKSLFIPGVGKKKTLGIVRREQIL